MGKSTEKGKALRHKLLNLQNRMFDEFVESPVTNSVLSQNQINDYKLAFQEYLQVGSDLYKEKETNYRFSDIVARIPNNLWVIFHQEVARKLTEPK